MTREEFASATARKTFQRAVALCVAAGGVAVIVLSTDPYFNRFDPMALWLARAGGVLTAGLAFFFGAAHDNCPACGRPLGLGQVLQLFLNEAANSRRIGSGTRLKFKPCDLEKQA